MTIIHVFIKYKKEPVQYAAKCYFGYSIFHVEVMFVYCKYESAKAFFLRLTHELCNHILITLNLR